MTESEFQEFMITVGYRYQEKIKQAFNSFEGFRTIIAYSQTESRYTLSMTAVPAASDGSARISEKLRRFEADHKESVIRAKFSGKSLTVVLKMTIDSEIDREQLRQLIHFVTELHKSGDLLPVCGVCGRQKNTGLYVVGRELVPICDNCLTRKRRQYEKRRDKFILKKQNMPAGLVGAVFGAVLGAVAYIMLYQFVPMFGIGSALIILLSFSGFVVTGERATKKSGIICGLISLIVFIAAEYAAIVANMAILIERQGGGIAVSEAIGVINANVSGDPSYLLTVMPDICIGIAVMAVTGILYFLKRKYTRPLKISGNVL